MSRRTRTDRPNAGVLRKRGEGTGEDIVEEGALSQSRFPVDPHLVEEQALRRARPIDTPADKLPVRRQPRGELERVAGEERLDAVPHYDRSVAKDRGGGPIADECSASLVSLNLPLDGGDMRRDGCEALRPQVRIAAQQGTQVVRISRRECGGEQTLFAHGALDKGFTGKIGGVDDLRYVRIASKHFALKPMKCLVEEKHCAASEGGIDRHQHDGIAPEREREVEQGRFELSPVGRSPDTARVNFRHSVPHDRSEGAARLAARDRECSPVRMHEDEPTVRRPESGPQGPQGGLRTANEGEQRHKRRIRRSGGRRHDIDNASPHERTACVHSCHDQRKQREPVDEQPLHVGILESLESFTINRPRVGLSIASRVRRASRLAALIACLVGGALFTGCADDAGNERAGTDGNGVQTVVSDDMTIPPRWGLSPSPLLFLDAEPETGSTMLNPIGAARLADGRFVVADGHTPALYMFTASGTRTIAIGRSGEGPAEFRSLTWIGVLPGDTIVAWDPVLKRLSRFDGAGQFLASMVLDQLAGTFAQVVGSFADGTLIAHGGFDPGRLYAAGTGVRRDTVTLVRIASDGRLLDTIARVPGAERFVAVANGAFAMHPVPFGSQPILAVGPQEAYLGTGEELRLTRIDRDGERTLVVHRAMRTRPVAPGDIAQYRDERLKLVGASDAKRTGLLRVLDAVPYPETMPAIAQALIDSRRFLWVQRYDPSPSAPLDWLVFDPDGQAAARLVFPERFVPWVIGDDWLIGGLEDEDGAMRVALFGLERWKHGP